jgi:TRAP-type mannitol/chloroaromatic compound transport system substrate-binding protein
MLEAPNPWNNRTALFAICVAFLVGLIGALSIRYSDSETDTRVQTNEAGKPVEQAIRWRVPVSFGTNLPALGDNVLDVSGFLRAATNGRIDLKVFEPGTLVPPFSVTEAVRQNKTEAGYTWLGYDQGKIPATPLIAAVPFGMEPWEYAAWYFEDEGEELTQALYHPHNVHPILCGLVGPETAGWFRSPIETLDDFEGLKIRFAGIGGKVLQKLGASVTMIPGGEIFQALEKGAIDATEFSMPAVDQMLGFDRVAKYNYFPGWHQTFTASHLVINLGVWQALPESDRALLNMACSAGVIRNLARGEAIQGRIIEGYPGKGVTPVKLDQAILKELQKVTESVLQEEADKDVDFRRIWDSQKQFLETYQKWKDHAYLPRDF